MPRSRWRRVPAALMCPPLTCRVPPTLSDFSTTATCAPCAAASIAHARPAVPAPRTTTSNGGLNSVPPDPDHSEGDQTRVYGEHERVGVAERPVQPLEPLRSLPV